jgi:Co/Zn/Cd efflux system component
LFHAPPLKHHPTERTAAFFWVALFINAAKFSIEVLAGWQAHSISLQAVVLDFFGDTTTYAITLVVLGIGVRAEPEPEWPKEYSLVCSGYGSK